MDEYCKSLGKKSMAMEHYNQPEEVVVEKPNVYDLIRQWADDRGIYKNGDTKTQFAKLQEEAGELARAILKNDKPEFIDAIGDMIVVLTNLAALEGLKVEDCVISAYDVIKSRQGKMVNGTFVKELNQHLTSTL
jgi:NTP pyrophosphatase (non-canonical NTP hydrolase)